MPDRLTLAELEALAAATVEPHGKIAFGPLKSAIVLCGKRSAIQADWIAWVVSEAAKSEIVTREACRETEDASL